MSPETFDRWERVEGLYAGPVTSWIELAVDEAGNLLAVAELVLSALPSLAVPQILAARSTKGGERRGAPFAGPVELLGPKPNVPVVFMGNPPAGSETRKTLRDEYSLLGLPLAEGNEDRSAGLTRVRELLRLDPDHRFPDWHQKAGEAGAPRLFVTAAACPRLVEQLSSAPLAEDDEPLARAAVSRRWEPSGGGLVAAIRYAAMSRPSPSKPPEVWHEDPRRRAMHDYIEKANKGPRRVRYQYT